MSIDTLAHAQETLVFSAVKGTSPTKIIQKTLQHAYQKIGIRIELKELPGERGLIYSQKGITDGVAFRTKEIEQQFNNLKRIDVPLSVDEMFFFVKRGNEFQVEGWQSVPKGQILAYQRGVKFAQNNTAKFAIKTYTVADSDQLFLLLKYDRVDVVIAGATMGSRIIKEMNLQEIVRLSPPIHTSVLYHYLHKKHDHIIAKISAVLKDMESSGELQMIQEGTR